MAGDIIGKGRVRPSKYSLLNKSNKNTDKNFQNQLF